MRNEQKIADYISILKVMRSKLLKVFSECDNALKQRLEFSEKCEIDSDFQRNKDFKRKTFLLKCNPMSIRMKPKTTRTTKATKITKTSTVPVRKVHQCSDCAYKSRWERDLRSHLRKEHSIVLPSFRRNYVHIFPTCKMSLRPRCKRYRLSTYWTRMASKQARNLKKNTCFNK